MKLRMVEKRRGSVLSLRDGGYSLKGRPYVLKGPSYVLKGPSYSLKDDIFGEAHFARVKRPGDDRLALIETRDLQATDEIEK